MKQTNKVDSSTTPTENESTLTDSLKSAATTGAIALKVLFIFILKTTN